MAVPAEVVKMAMYMSPAVAAEFSLCPALSGRLAVAVAVAACLACRRREGVLCCE